MVLLPGLLGSLWSISPSPPAPLISIPCSTCEPGAALNPPKEKERFCPWIQALPEAEGWVAAFL